MCWQFVKSFVGMFCVPLITGGVWWCQSEHKGYNTNYYHSHNNPQVFGKLTEKFFKLKQIYKPIKKQMYHCLELVWALADTYLSWLIYYEFIIYHLTKKKDLSFLFQLIPFLENDNIFKLNYSRAWPAPCRCVARYMAKDSTQARQWIYPHTLILNTNTNQPRPSGQTAAPSTWFRTPVEIVILTMGKNVSVILQEFCYSVILRS